ncbi:hypothetical protein EVAR_47655_1 [Eumeta japonica]|uniref:Uncharacterized protein n=1 Tax=Eumeta variegata TaxID=151549 RepID=A0A4C1Y287_EUMVA|nr:hypothetical protein EVAR_47655_1 [Eumeta japonica]
MRRPVTAGGGGGGEGRRGRPRARVIVSADIDTTSRVRPAGAAPTRDARAESIGRGITMIVDTLRSKSRKNESLDIRAHAAADDRCGRDLRLRLCAAAISLLLGRIGRWSGQEIACSALSLARLAQVERDNESCFFPVFCPGRAGGRAGAPGAGGFIAVASLSCKVRPFVSSDGIRALQRRGGPAAAGRVPDGSNCPEVRPSTGCHGLVRARAQEFFLLKSVNDTTEIPMDCE